MTTVHRYVTGADGAARWSGERGRVVEQIVVVGWRPQAHVWSCPVLVDR